MKKAKKVPGSWKSTFHKGQYLKPAIINIASVFKHVRKKMWNLLTPLMQFTDQQIQLKKQHTVEKNLPIYASTKYFPI